MRDMLSPKHEAKKQVWIGLDAYVGLNYTPWRGGFTEKVGPFQSLPVDAYCSNG